MEIKKYFYLVFLLLGLQGCEGIVHGFVYSHTSQPLTDNFHQTPVGVKTGKLGTKHLDIQLEATWDSNSIGDIASEYGFKKVYYADIETLKILGIWEQNWVHLYGE